MQQRLVPEAGDAETYRPAVTSRLNAGRRILNHQAFGRRRIQSLGCNQEESAIGLAVRHIRAIEIGIEDRQLVRSEANCALCSLIRFSA
jgi:hypothetical protein